MAEKRGRKSSAKSSKRSSAVKSRSASARKTSAPKKNSRSRSKRPVRPVAAARSPGSIKKNLRVVLNNLVLFILLFLVSLILYQVLGEGIFKNLFSVFTILFGFVSVAFLISLLVFLFLKVFKKR